MNPVYSDISSRLADVSGRSAASSERIKLGRELLEEEMARGDRVASASGTMTELTRDYEVNRDVYKELLKRRENAQRRDEHGHGEARPDLPRTGAGRDSAAAQWRAAPDARGRHRPVPGVIAPLLFVFGMLKVDNRVRSPAQVEQLAGLPVLGTIPMQNTPRRREDSRRKLGIACMLILAVPLAYGLALSARWILAQ